MEKLSKRSPKEKYLVDMLQHSIIAEQTAGDFYRYIAKKIKNGNIRNKFMKFSDEEARKHKTLLSDRLRSITGTSYNPDLSKLDTSIKISSFSLIGALSMAKESEKKAVEFYKKVKIIDKKYKEVYDEILREENKHWKVIDQEKSFQEKKEIFRDNKGVRLLSLLMQIYS